MRTLCLTTPVSVDLHAPHVTKMNKYSHAVLVFKETLWQETIYSPESVSVRNQPTYEKFMVAIICTIFMTQRYALSHKMIYVLDVCLGF